MSLLMEPGQTYNSWEEFKSALDTHSKENKVIFNIANAKTVEQSNAFMKKGPLYEARLKYSHCILQCKHFGSYTSSSAGLRPKQRSYKIDCRAFISISACRKKDYLIIRDSYHKHSHPCTEEIYNSYPEVRRMTKDERRMVGTLMDMGVPVSQIKTAVGKNVTPKDLHNAKNHIRAVKMGLKDDLPKSRAANKRNAHLRVREEKEDVTGGEILIDSGDDRDETTSTTNGNSEPEDKTCTSQIQNDTQEDAGTASCPNNDSNDSSDAIENTVVPDNTLVEEKSSGNSSETNNVSNILSTLNVSTQSVIAVPNNDNSGGDKPSYTVIMSTGEDGRDSSQVIANLQEIFHKLQTEGLPKKATSAQSTVIKTKILDQMHSQAEEAKMVKAGEKNCEYCGKYMSPLDGHSLCLSCLGPQHLHQQNCPHCQAMKPEQLNIRRKLLVRMRMKALKEMNESRKQGGFNPDQPAQDSGLFTPRKSKRVRKPKDFGPDMTVHNIFSPNRVDGKSLPKVTKCVVNDGEKEYLVEIPKREVEEDCMSYSLETESPPSSSATSDHPSQNSERFSHLLKQTEVFEDVVLQQNDNGVLGYAPDVTSVLAINKAMSQSDLPAIPKGLDGKYGLDPQFESSHCSIPSTVDTPGDQIVNSMSSGLHKLAQNATVQTKLAIYDKLFTRLGVGMADEALEILSQLYGKVMNVTEISQEDLTNDLQTALDTIQALKDVLEELGLMSKDSFSTALHQRSISIHSLNKARNALKKPSLNLDDSTPSNPKRRKFEPFTKNRLPTQTSVASEPYSQPISESITSNDHQQEVKFEVCESVQHSNPEDSTLKQHHIVMEVASLPTQISPTVLAPVMNVSPMTLSSELLERLQSKDGVIELNMVKDNEIILNSDTGGTVEIHQEVLQQPQQKTVLMHTSGETE